jgi:hypothetical protein
MNSPIANLFLALQARIAGLHDNDGNNYFRYVDQDTGQLEMLKNGRYPVSWPCVLIDVDKIDFTDDGTRIQSGTGTVSLRMGFPPYSASSNITPSEYRTKALYYYDLEQVLYLALQHWNPSQQEGFEALADIFGSFRRASSVTEPREDFVRVRQISYTIALDDYSAKKQQLFAPAALDLNIGINA